MTTAAVTTRIRAVPAAAKRPGLPGALDVVKRMDSRYGVFMCEGNHDLMVARHEFERRTQAYGVPLLVHESPSAHARGRGAYRALVAARWADAVERGTPALVTQAGAMSKPMLSTAVTSP